MNYEELGKALRWCDADFMHECDNCLYVKYKHCKDDCMDRMLRDAAAAIEALQAEVNRLQEKLCDWCAVCPKERRKPEDCEMLSETPVMYGPSCEKKE